MLQAFAWAKLVQAAALAARSLCRLRSGRLRSATMRAYAGFRFKAGLRFCRCLSSQLQPVVMLLNDEGGRQQSLKGLLVKRQVGPVRGHGIWGRRTVQTELIVVQVWPSENERRRRAFWKGFPIGDANLEVIHENGLREGRGGNRSQCNCMVLNGIVD